MLLSYLNKSYLLKICVTLGWMIVFFVVVVVCSELLVGLNICMDHSLTVYIFLSVLSFHVNEKRFPFCRVLLILSIQNKQIFMLY